MNIRDEIKRDFGISNVFINRIDYLTYFSNFTINARERKFEQTLMDKGFFVNKESHYIGRYYKHKNYNFWIGYDFRNIKGKRFYISVYSPDDKFINNIDLKKINYERVISRIDGNKYWINFYIDENLIYLQGTDINNKNFNSENSEDNTDNFDDAKQEISNIISTLLEINT